MPVYSVDIVYKDDVQVYVVKKFDKDIAICGNPDDAMDIAHALNLYKSDVYLTKSEFYNGSHPLELPDADLLRECPHCNYQNRAVESRCRSCKRDMNAAPGWEQSDPDRDDDMPSGYIKCACGALNRHSDDRCNICFRKVKQL